MPPRWIKTKDVRPSRFGPNFEPDDWSLISGSFVVGRVLPASGDRVQGRFTWTITGPHTPEAPVSTGGSAKDVHSAKAALLASWRKWQEWAGMQDRDV